MLQSKTFLFALIICFSACVSAQPQQQDNASSGDAVPSQSTPSLADIAKEAKKRKAESQAHAKKVVTNEELGSSHGPLPALDFKEDNSNEVLEAIGQYQSGHSAQETETAVHQWFDEYDAVLLAAIRGNMSESDRRSDTVYNGYWGCQDSPSYQSCVARRRAELRGQHDDQWAQRNDGYTVGHVQQEFMRVKSGMFRYGLHYEWFRIRSGNGQGTF
jgi:hypothetical protein